MEIKRIKDSKKDSKIMKRSSLIFFFSIIIVLIAYLYRDNLANFKSLGLIGVFIINLVGSATLFLPTPAIVSVIAGGAIYPPILVALASSVGASMGDMTGYFIGLSGDGILIKKHKKYILVNIIKNMFTKYGAISILLFAFIPNPLFDFIGIISGIFLYPMRRFFILMFIGRFFRNIILAYLGSVFR